MSMHNHITKLVRGVSSKLVADGYAQFCRTSVYDQYKFNRTITETKAVVEEKSSSSLNEYRAIHNRTTTETKAVEEKSPSLNEYRAIHKQVYEFGHPQRVGAKSSCLLAFSRPTTSLEIYYAVAVAKLKLAKLGVFDDVVVEVVEAKNIVSGRQFGYCFTRPGTTTTIYHRNEADIGNRRRNFHIRQYHHTSQDADHGDELFELCKSLKPIDWRIAGVADVKNQGQTPSCSSHACATLLEMLIFRKYGQKIQISVHDLWNGSNDGRNIPTDIFKWVMKNGVVRESDVPWLGREEEWVRKEGVEVYRMIREVKLMGFRETYDFALALYDGPFVVLFEPGDSWFSYESGSYSGESESESESGSGSESVELHGVVVVALQFVDEVPYFVCQNSYGTEWGLGGFFYVPVQRRPPLFLTGYSVHLEEEMSVETN